MVMDPEVSESTPPNRLPHPLQAGRVCTWYWLGLVFTRVTYTAAAILGLYALSTVSADSDYSGASAAPWLLLACAVMMAAKLAKKACRRALEFRTPGGLRRGFTASELEQMPPRWPDQLVTLGLGIGYCFSGLWVLHEAAAPLGMNLLGAVMLTAGMISFAAGVKDQAQAQRAAYEVARQTGRAGGIDTALDKTRALCLVVYGTAWSTAVLFNYDFHPAVISSALILVALLAVAALVRWTLRTSSPLRTGTSADSRSSDAMADLVTDTIDPGASITVRERSRRWAREWARGLWIALAVFVLAALLGWAFGL